MGGKMENRKHPIIDFIQCRQPVSHLPLPLLTCTVAAGFPSPADDHIENSLDLNDLLIRRPAATFYLYAKGTSMRGAGICDNDILVIDKSQTPVHGSMIVAAIDNECLIKIFCQQNRRIWLQSANPDFPAIPITEETPFEIWGVVVGVVRPLGDKGRVCID
jgi:DNA polymerase V